MAEEERASGPPGTSPMWRMLSPAGQQAAGPPWTHEHETCTTKHNIFGAHACS